MDGPGAELEGLAGQHPGQEDADHVQLVPDVVHIVDVNKLDSFKKVHSIFIVTLGDTPKHFE